MAFLQYLQLLLCFLVSGWGVLTLFQLRLKTGYTITLSLLLGIAIASILPFFLQLLYIPLTSVSVFGLLWVVAVALNIPTFRRIRREGWSVVRRSFGFKPFRVLPYEIPFLAVIAFVVLVSVWRCYYLPPTSRDVLSGPEAIAQFALSEHSMINSFFNIDLWSTNNPFKSPFLISLQLIYKMAGFPFGQEWLSIVFVSFIVFLYHAIKEKQHPIIAGLLLLIFLMSPEMYAYSFLILYDYSNAVYFFLSLFFLFGYFRNKTLSWFWFSGLLMGIATYIRSETLVLAFLFLPAILLAQRRERLTAKRMALSALGYFLPSLLLYYLPGPLYLQHYLPVHYDVRGLINPHLTDLGPLFQRYSDILTHLIDSHFGVELWGYIYFIALILLVAECFSPGRFNKDARNWLYGMLMVYLGLGALGFILPLINLNETTKRGLFKLMPLTVLYLANNDWLVRLSGWISRWEKRPGKVAPVAIGKSGSAAAGGGKVGTAGGGKSAGKSGSAPKSKNPRGSSRKGRRK